MCLAVPAKVLTCMQGEGTVDLHGSHVEVNFALTPEVHCGDWVLVHAGFAIQQLSAEEAKETFAVLRGVEEAAEQ